MKGISHKVEGLGLSTLGSCKVHGFGVLLAENSLKDTSITHILFDQGKKLGEVSDWKMTPSEPVYKDVLGKRVLLPAKNDECSFVVPKPVNRKSQLTIVEDKKTELVLQVISVRGMTVTASIVARNKL